MADTRDLKSLGGDIVTVQVRSPVPYWGIAKLERHRTLTPAFVGSSPTTPAKYFIRKEKFMNGEWRDNSESWDDWDDDWDTIDSDISPYEKAHRVSMTSGDEMTEEDWDRYGEEFERRYNEHLRSLKEPRRVGKAIVRGEHSKGNYYYDEDDDIGSLLPTTEELDRMRKQLGMDDHYNIACAVYDMTQPHEDTMAAFFLENCF